MKKLSFALIILMTFTVIACNNSKDKNDLSEREISIKEITSAEENLFDDIQPDIDKANSMIKMYLKFVESYPTDTLSPEYLFKASEIAMNFEQAHNSIRYLTKIETDYPDYSKYPTVIFMKGFIYHYEIGDLENAQKYYKIYLEKYPNHTFVKDAEGALLFLGMNDEELIDLFEDMNKYN